MIKKIIASILLSLGITTAEAEPEQIEIKKPSSTISMTSSSESNGVITKVWENDFDHRVVTTENKEGGYYTLEYDLKGCTYSYHTHTEYDFKDMMRVHQKNIDAGFEGFEWINPTKNEYYESEQTAVNVFRERYWSIRHLERLERGEIVDEEDSIMTRESCIETLKKYGYDWEHQIDYYTEYGKDWECVVKHRK